MRKVDTTENLADALTKFVTAEELRYHIANTGQIIVPGRHELAPITTDINYVGHHTTHITTNVKHIDNSIKQTRSLDRHACPCTLCSALRIRAPARDSHLPFNPMATPAKEECRLERTHYGSRSTLGSCMQLHSSYRLSPLLAQVTLSYQVPH